MDGILDDWEQQDLFYQRVKHFQRPVGGVMQPQLIRPPFMTGAPWQAAHSANNNALRAATLAELARRARVTANVFKQEVKEKPRGSWEQQDLDMEAQWIQHENRWHHIKSGRLPLNVMDIPWPPSLEGILGSMALHEARKLASSEAGQEQAGQQALLMKRAYHKATLRWHPDKLKSRLTQAQCIPGDSLHAAITRATQVFLAVNQEWQAWNRQTHSWALFV